MKNIQIKKYRNRLLISVCFLIHILHLQAKYTHEKKTCAYKQAVTVSLINDIIK